MIDSLIWAPVFVPVRVTHNPATGKWDKIPLGRNGRPASALDPANWMPYVDACCVSGGAVGIVLTEGLGLACLDVDHAYDPATGQWSALAIDLCNRFPLAYVELSVSGTGLHIIFAHDGTLDPRRRVQIDGLGVYTHSRFILLTGTGARGDALVDYSAELRACVGRELPAAATSAHDDEWRSEPLPGWAAWAGSPTDEQIIARIRNKVPRQALVTGVTGKQLWDDRDETLAAYDNDNSGVDLALANHTLVATGFDSDRAMRLLLESGIYRPKFDRPDYLERTLRRAMDQRSRFPQWEEARLTPSVDTAGVPVVTVDATTPDAELKTATLILGSDMFDYFKGCIYVLHEKAVWMPNGQFLRESEFKAKMSRGNQFQMTVDGKSDRNPWLAFHMSETFRCPSVDALYFSPADPYRHIRSDPTTGHTSINTWKPPVIRSVAGDVSRYTDLLELQLPVVRDREILLAWMAAAVQYPGKKFRWAPYLQGVKGGGKTTHMEILEYCIGEDYSCRPTAKNIDKQFNAIFDRKLLVGVDDINLTERGGMWDTLKPMITGGKLEIERKGVDSYTARDMCLRFVFTGNHKRGLPVSADERRVAPFFFAQQTLEQRDAAGLTERYFVEMRKWLDADGFAAIHHWLSTYAIPHEFNPGNGCVVAPETSFTDEARQVSHGGVEQYLQEAIDSHELGASGRITGPDLRRFLDASRSGGKILPGAWDDVMRSIGWKPAGRAAPDANGYTPRVWIRG